jgi:hypothetical protein
MRIAYILALLLAFSCELSMKGSKSVTKTHKDREPTKTTTTEALKTPLGDVPLEQRVIVDGDLSKNALAVLKAAFETDYDENDHDVNAYDFPNYGGDRGMDWWNFPWDLPSTRSQFTITYNDMKEMLEKVKVRKTKNSPDFISYGEMLKEMVLKLTPQIMNAHGGVLRVVKIIYCVRNFLAVAISHSLTKDIAHLKVAAQKLIDIDATKTLLQQGSHYTKTSTYHPVNVLGQPEDRTPADGIEEQKRLIAMP